MSTNNTGLSVSLGLYRIVLLNGEVEIGYKVAEALRYLEEGHARGKVVITMEAHGSS